LEKPYPRAAIQTPLMAIANPIATGGQAVRNASTALATMTGLSPFQSPLIQRAMTFAGARRESTFPPSAHAASSIKLAAVGAWLGSCRSAARGRLRPPELWRKVRCAGRGRMGTLSSMRSHLWRRSFGRAVTKFQFIRNLMDVFAAGDRAGNTGIAELSSLVTRPRLTQG